MEMRSLKGREASRWRRVGEESAAMRCVIRVERGGEDGFEGSGSGFGSVRERAMFAALAPRSRT
jgi:hypothetical protein